MKTSIDAVYSRASPRTPLCWQRNAWFCHAPSFSLRGQRSPWTRFAIKTKSQSGKVHPPTCSFLGGTKKHSVRHAERVRVRVRVRQCACVLNSNVSSEMQRRYRSMPMNFCGFTSNRRVCVCVCVCVCVRGLLPDPNPRVPKYCRVSGRVSG